MSSVNKPDPSAITHRASMPPSPTTETPTQEHLSAEKADDIEQKQFGGVPVPFHETSISSDSIPHTANPQPEFSITQYLSSVVSTIKQNFRDLYNSLFKKAVTDTPPVTPSVGILIEGKLKQLKLAETQLKTLKINLANANQNIRQLPYPGGKPNILTIDALTANIATLQQEIDGLSQRLPHVILKNVQADAEEYQKNLHRAATALSTESGTLDPRNPVEDLITRKIVELTEKRKTLLNPQKEDTPLKRKLLKLAEEIDSYRGLKQALPNSLNSTQRKQAHTLVQAEYERVSKSLDSDTNPFQSTNSIDLTIQPNQTYEEFIQQRNRDFPNQMIAGTRERDLHSAMKALLTETGKLDPINPITDLVTKKISELTDQRKVLYNRLNFFEKFLGRHLDIWREDITNLDKENISYQYLQEALPNSLNLTQRKQAYNLAKTEYETILLNSILTSYDVKQKPPLIEIEKSSTYETPAEEFPRQYVSILQGIEEELHFEQVLSEIKDEKNQLEKQMRELALRIDATDAPDQKDRLQKNLAKLQESLNEVDIKEIVHEMEKPELSSTETLHLIEALCDLSMSLMNKQTAPNELVQGSSVAGIAELIAEIKSLETQLRDENLSFTDRGLLEIELENYENKLAALSPRPEYQELPAFKVFQEEIENLYEAVGDQIGSDMGNSALQQSLILLQSDKDEIAHIIHLYETGSKKELEEMLPIKNEDSELIGLINDKDKTLLIILTMRTKIIKGINALIEERKTQMDLES